MSASRGTYLLREAIRVPGLEDVPVLLEEYERLFVGPVRCHALLTESFWREDVPDIRDPHGAVHPRNQRRSTGAGLQVSSLSGRLPDHIASNSSHGLRVVLRRDRSRWPPAVRQAFAQGCRGLCRASPTRPKRFLPDLAVSHARLDSGNSRAIRCALRLMPTAGGAGRSHIGDVGTEPVRFARASLLPRLRRELPGRLLRWCLQRSALPRRLG